MTDFNQYNNVALMAAIQEFYEQRARSKSQASLTAPKAATQPASPSRITGAIATLRRIANTPLPTPWRRIAA